LGSESKLIHIFNISESKWSQKLKLTTLANTLFWILHSSQEREFSVLSISDHPPSSLHFRHKESKSFRAKKIKIFLKSSGHPALQNCTPVFRLPSGRFPRHMLTGSSG